jgi:ribosomal protein L20
VDLDRKILADMAVRDPKVFREYVELLRSGKLKATSSKS